MAISAVGSAANSTLTSSRNTIADNFDTFLNLLTTQLRNQNPLDPLDTNQFTSQMVQFTSVEQQLKTNEFLEALVLSNLNNTYTESVSFIGKQVTANGAATELSEGDATWTYTAQRDAPNTVITIRDLNGNTVFTDTANFNLGTGQYHWDGHDNNGNQLPDGTYSITIDARDDNGYIPVSTQTTGIVEAVDLSGVEPTLIIGDSRIPMSSITSVSQVG